MRGHMKKMNAVIFCSALLLSTAHAGEMYQALRQETSREAAVILLAQARLESCYDDSIGLKSVRGVAARNGYNIWNVTATRGPAHVEREGGRLIKKRWCYWKTAKEGAREFIAYLKRKYPGALSRAERGDVKGYVHALKRGGYFSVPENEYAEGVEKWTKELKKGEKSDKAILER